MYRIFISLLVIGSTLLFAVEDTYVFEAKGAFAKELKTLVEKYSKEGKIQATVYKKDSSVIDRIFNNKTVNINGKNIYIKKCASCHGQKGNINPSSQTRYLKNMTRQELEDAIYGYRNDMHYGGFMKTIMQQKAIGLNENKVVAIYNYLHGEEKSLKSSEKIENSNTEKSSYLQ